MGGCELESSDRIWTSGELLWTRWWFFGCQKMLRLSWLVKQLLVSQEELSKLVCYGCCIAQTVRRRLPTRRLEFDPRLVRTGFLADKMALEQVFSKYIGFPWQFSINRVQHIHLSSWVGTVGPPVSGLLPLSTMKKVIVVSFIFTLSFFFLMASCQAQFSVSHEQ